MQVLDFLKKLGLTLTESNIYVTGLSHEYIGVSELVKLTGIQRTTVYHALETLMQKGLVSKRHVDGRMCFSMAKPADLQNFIERNIAELKVKKIELEKILPLINQYIPKQIKKTTVQHFEGIEGIKTVVEEALYCKSRRWDIIAPPNNFFREFDKSYAEYFLSQRIKNGIVTRSLWEPDKSRRLLTPKELEFRNPKILPDVMHGKFEAVLLIFDDRVALISSVKDLSAILITSNEFHGMMLAIFDGLWVNSRLYGKS